MDVGRRIFIIYIYNVLKPVTNITERIGFELNARPSCSHGLCCVCTRARARGTRKPTSHLAQRARSSRYRRRRGYARPRRPYISYSRPGYETHSAINTRVKCTRRRAVPAVADLRSGPDYVARARPRKTRRRTRSAVR